MNTTVNGHIGIEASPLKPRSFTKFLVNEILLAGHLQSMGAAGIIILTSVVLQEKVSLWLVASFYMTSYAIYSFNRWIELDQDEIDNPERTQHIRSQKNWNIVVIATNALLPLSLTLYFDGGFILAALVIYIVLGFAYSLGGKSITKSIPLFKNLYVGVFFGSVTFCTSLLYSNYQTNLYLVSSLALLAFTRTFGMSMVLDIKDVRADRAYKLRTLPVMIGSQATVVVASLITIIPSFILYYLFSNGIIEGPFLPVIELAVISLIPGILAFLFSNSPKATMIWEGVGPAIWTISSSLVVWSQNLL